MRISKFLIGATGALLLAATPVLAATTVETETSQVPPPAGKRMIPLSEFDLNRDGLMSTYEVGEMLFSIFDLNATGGLEPTEYENKSLLTVVPMEKTTTVMRDYNNDGLADDMQTTVQTFMQETQLARFDSFKNGLSPHDFVDTPFRIADADGNGTVDLAEWRNTYMAHITPAIVAPAAGP